MQTLVNYHFLMREKIGMKYIGTLLDFVMVIVELKNI